MHNVRHSLLNPTVATAMILVVFLCLQLYFVWGGGRNGVFNSPDANANYHFSLRLSQGHSLRIPLAVEPSFAQPYLATRSTRVIDSNLVPVGFLGLEYIYGLISAVLFLNLIPYLTILFAVAGLSFFYRFVAGLFSAWVSFFSILLIILHPAWWYYTNDSLLPNVLFMSVCMIAIYFLDRMRKSKATATAVIAATFLSLAIFVRMSETLWILPTLVVYLFAIRNSVTKKNCVIFLAILVASTVGFGYIQYISLSGTSIIGYNISAVSRTSLGYLGSLLLPFGFHPRSIFVHAWNYYIRFFWPYTAGLVLGLFFGGASLRKNRSWLFYSVAVAFISSVLLIYYGSWQISDSPGPNAITIGTSYVRYFLPTYILVIPIMVQGWFSLKRAMDARLYRYTSIFALICIAVFSFNVVFSSAGEGIIAKNNTLKDYDALATLIREDTPGSSIIVTAKGDKYVWPARNVITSFDRAEGTRAIAFFLQRGNELFYLAPTLNESALSKLNSAWREYAIEVGSKLWTLADTSLYHVREYHAPTVN